MTLRDARHHVGGGEARDDAFGEDGGPGRGVVDVGVAEERAFAGPGPKGPQQVDHRKVLAAPQELPEFPELPRLIIPFNRSRYARLRQLIDFINALPDSR